MRHLHGAVISLEIDLSFQLLRSIITCPNWSKLPFGGPVWKLWKKLYSKCMHFFNIWELKLTFGSWYLKVDILGVDILGRWPSMISKTYILCILEYTSLLWCYNQIQKFIMEQIDIVAICTLQWQNVFRRSKDQNILLLYIATICLSAQ